MVYSVPWLSACAISMQSSSSYLELRVLDLYVDLRLCNRQTVQGPHEAPFLKIVLSCHWLLNVLVLPFLVCCRVSRGILLTDRSLCPVKSEGVEDVRSRFLLPDTETSSMT